MNLIYLWRLTIYRSQYVTQAEAAPVEYYALPYSPNTPISTYYNVDNIMQEISFIFKRPFFNRYFFIL